MDKTGKKVIMDNDVMLRGLKLWWGIMESDNNKATLTTFLDNVVSGVSSAILGSSTTEGVFLSQQVADGFAKSGFASYQWYLENKKLLKVDF
jgi:hypothetical protein